MEKTIFNLKIGLISLTFVSSIFSGGYAGMAYHEDAEFYGTVRAFLINAQQLVGLL